MVTRIKARADDLFCAWSKAQADLLRAGRSAELDLDHLTLEIEDVGGASKRSVRNRIRTIVEHLLKLEHSPAREPRADWRATVDPVANVLAPCCPWPNSGWPLRNASVDPALP